MPDSFKRTVSTIGAENMSFLMGGRETIIYIYYMVSRHEVLYSSNANFKKTYIYICNIFGSLPTHGWIYPNVVLYW